MNQTGHLKYLSIMSRASAIAMRRDGEIVLSRGCKKTWYSICEDRAWDRYVLRINNITGKGKV